MGVDEVELAERAEVVKRLKAALKPLYVSGLIEYAASTNSQDLMAVALTGSLPLNLREVVLFQLTTALIDGDVESLPMSHRKGVEWLYAKVGAVLACSAGIPEE
jgi:hypothetical protein